MFNDDDIKIKLAVSDEQIEATRAVRKKVFVKELGLSEKKDRENDNCSIHILAYIQKGHRILPVGTMRIRSFGDFVKFERMAVTRHFRKTNVAEAIMQYAFNFAAIKGHRKVLAACKEELLPRWKRSGFYTNKKMETIEENGMKLIRIYRDLPKHPLALTINSDPALLLASEGELAKKAQETSIIDGARLKLAELNEKKKFEY